MSQNESIVNQEDISYTLDNNVPEINGDASTSHNVDGSVMIPE